MYAGPLPPHCHCAERFCGREVCEHDALFVLSNEGVGGREALVDDSLAGRSAGVLPADVMEVGKPGRKLLHDGQHQALSDRLVGLHVLKEELS